MPFDSESSSHNGSAVGEHYFPKVKIIANEKNPFECARSNSLGQWTVIQPANGDVADQLWRKEGCRIMCPCKENVGGFVLSHEQRYFVFYILIGSFSMGWGFVCMSCPTKREKRAVTRYGMRGYHRALLSNDAEQIKSILSHMGSTPLGSSDLGTLELSIDQTNTHTFSRLATQTIGSTINPSQASITPTHRLSHSRYSLTESSVFDSDVSYNPQYLPKNLTSEVAMTV